jgi:hypothetical protein
LFVLGGGSLSSLDAWGLAWQPISGCLCLRMPPAGEWRRWTGQSQFGLPRRLVADLSLRVGLALRERRLPAALGKFVLSAATQDWIDQTAPTDADDWITAARDAQSIMLRRFEDYVAAAAADGPLIPEAR